MKKYFLGLALVLCVTMLSSCSDDKEEPFVPTPLDVAELIQGSWLSSSSFAGNWITYEFTTTSRINVEFCADGYCHTGSGIYSIDEAALSGYYTSERGNSYYIDWIVEGGNAFEIEYQLYDDNTYLGMASLYRLLSTFIVGVGKSITPDYGAIATTKDVSNFEIIDSSIATVDASTGEITGLAVGTTFVTFDTPNGTVAVKVDVQNDDKSYDELIVGTWIYDNIAENEWQRTRFVEDGYVFAEWQLTDALYDLNETGEGYYTLSDGGMVEFTITTPYGLQMEQQYEIIEMNDFIWTYNAYSYGAMVGQYTVNRLLESVTLNMGETAIPVYQSLVNGYNVAGFTVNNSSVATVDSSTGMITAVTPGRTYVNVLTAIGAGVVEVNVVDNVIPYDFGSCIGQPASKVHEVIGYNPYFEDATSIIYINPASEIESIGVSLDSWSGNVAGIVVSYNSSVNTSDVTAILDKTYIPYMSQTTDNYKAYMDADSRAEANIGVTWDIIELELVYVNLFNDLFVDYSSLIGMTHEQVISKMGMEPSSDTDELQSFFINSDGVAMVGAFYTDYVDFYDNVQSVVTLLDGTLTKEEVHAFLCRKYNYYPEYDFDSYEVFISKDQTMVIYYDPESDTIIYYPFTVGTDGTRSMAAMKKRLVGIDK